MKKYILFLLLLLSYSATAQVGINANGTAPASAAMLDVSSTNKGVLIPRMTTTQKNAIQNPVEGLMVYDTDVKQFSYCLAVFAGTAVNCQWVNFGNTQVPPTSWNVNGNDISSSNSGKVGIGVVNPTLGKLQVVENNPNSPVYSAIWANNTSNGNGITGNAFNSGIGVWGTSGTGTGVEGRTTGSNSNSYGIFGNATGSGTGGYFYSASGNALITGNGNVGIGTNSPMAKLDVAGIIKIADGTQGIGKILTSDANGLSSWQAAGWAINGNSGNELKNTNSGGFWSAAATGLDFNTTNSTNPPTAPVGSSGTRLMWIPSRSAFRVGTIYDDGSNGGSNWDGSKIGLFSFATGLNTTASGRISTAFGNFTSAIGNASTAMGNITTASGVASYFFFPLMVGFFGLVIHSEQTRLKDLNVFAANLFDVPMLIAFYGLAIYYRKKIAYHIRFMVLTIVPFIDPAGARIPPFPGLQVMIVLMIGMVIYERFNNKIYKPYLIGLGIFVVNLGIVAYIVLFNKTLLESIWGIFFSV